MSEWKEYNMSELIDEIAMGPFGSNIKVDCFVKKGVPVLNGSNLTGFKLSEKSFNYVTKEKAESLGRSNAKRGDIIVTHRGTLGQVSYIPDDSSYDSYVISQSQFRFSCKKDLVFVPYLVYYFHSREGQYKLLSNACQVGVPALARPTSTFKEISVILPPIEEQKRIAGVLSSLDDKIDLLNRENATLEALAETLFRHHFIENPDPTWKEGKLGDVCCYVTDKVDADGLDCHSYISTENMLNDKKGVTEASSIPGNIRVTKYIVGDVLISNIRPYFKKIWLADGNGGCSNDVLCIRAENKELEGFLYYTLRQDDFFDYVMLGSKGCKMPRGDKQHIMNWQISVPDNGALTIFNEYVSTVIKKIKSNQQQIQTLTVQRNMLLPRLMSGEVKIDRQ